MRTVIEAASGVSGPIQEKVQEKVQGMVSPLREADCRVYHLGRLPYRRAWELQRALVARRKAGEIPDTLLLLEHTPVITLGRNGHRRHLLSSPETLQEQGIEFVETDRGGDITYHGPVQLIGYPILDLSVIRKDVGWYVRTLEEVLIRTAGDFGIRAGRREKLTGVWVDGCKLAAIGVRISRWVTSHGFALNVETDLGSFQHIVPCGISSCPVTSFRELLGNRADLGQVRERVTQHMGELFGLRMQAAEPKQLQRF